MSGTTARAREPALFGVSLALITTALIVLVGWHAHIPAAVQIVAGMNPMQYNTALTFLALGVAGLGLATSRRVVIAAGGSVAAFMGAAVILEFATGASSGIDTLFFQQWTNLGDYPGRMAPTSAASFLLSGLALVAIAVRPGALGLLWTLNAVPLSLGLTSLMSYLFGISYMLPFDLGVQMALHTAAAFTAYGVAILGYAWAHAPRGADGLPTWTAGISMAFLPVLLVGTSALFAEQSWRALSLEVVLVIGGLAMTTVLVVTLTKARVAVKGLMMTGIPLILLLMFVGLVVHAKTGNESAQERALHSIEVIGVSQALLARVAEAESAARGYVITGDASFVPSYEAALAKVAETSAQLHQLVTDNPGQEARAGRIVQLTLARTGRLAEIVGLIRSGRQPEAAARVKSGAGTALMTELTRELAEFAREEAHLWAVRLQVMETSWQRLSWLLVSGAAAAILLAGILTLSFTGGVSRRLQQLRTNATSLAAGRELAPPLHGHDEIAELDRAFHQMAVALDEVTRREKAVIEGTTDAIFVKNLEHRYLMMNEAGATMVGLPVDQIIGKTNDELIEAESARQIRLRDETVIATGQTITVEYNSTNQAGVERSYLSNRGPFRDRHGAIVGTFGISRDVTDQKRSEAALVESDRRFREFFYDAPVGYHELDPAGRITCVNTTELQILGYAENEMVGHSIFEFVEEADAARPVFAEWLAGTKQPETYEGFLRRKDGTPLAVQVDFRMIKDAEGRMAGIRATLQDITVRKQAEALIKASALQSAIFNSANFSSIATDARGVIQIFNVGAERMLGYTAAEVTNRVTPAEISDPEEIVARATALSAELGTPITPGFEALVFKASRAIEDIYELTYIRKDGTRCPAVVSVTALRNAAGGVIGYLLIGTDNTARRQIEAERKRLELRLQQKNAELEDANRMKSEFLANMSHELRTPLNAIIGFSEVLRDGLMGELPDKQRGFVSDIHRSGRHLLSLINDILDLSNVEAGRMTLDLEPVPVSSLFASSLSVIHEKASARQIHVDLDARTAETLGTIRADPRKVKQIMHNLLSNAVKFTDEGGRVTVRASRVPRGDVGRLSDASRGRAFPLAGSAYTDFLAISVTDSGIGIPPEAMDRLFQPFSQLDSGLARRFEGTGLGLVMVKALVQLHGGTVAVESTVGHGSCFTVWLPLHAPEAAPARVATAVAPGVEVPAGPRIALVVEDDPKSAQLIRLHLESEGFTVLHAISAETALALVVQHPVSLITLDVMLPYMDGWEFLNRVKRVPDLRSIPVLIISIMADTAKGFALGASAVMQKPTSRQDLYDALVDLALLPLPEGQTLKVLIVDDDPNAVELIALRLMGLTSSVLRAYGGRDAIAVARRELPDLIVLDLMMPEVSGFDVVSALHADGATARIPILVVTAKQITSEDRATLHGLVSTIMDKGEFGGDDFITEVRRAMSGRPFAA